MYSLNLENNAEVVGLSGVVNISADNQLHHVEIGTKLLKSDTLIMEENASVTIQYTDGSIVTYDQEAPSVQDELPDEFNEEEAAEETSIQDEIQAIQDAIASGGGDIETPATASGGNESQGGISFVSVERDDNTSIIGTDFSSEGLDTSTADSVDTPEIESNSADFIPDSEISLSTSINPSTGLVFVSGIVTNAGPNPVVTLTITDASGTNAPIVVSDVPVAPDGSYSIDSVNISALAEGQLTVNVSVTDDNAQTSEAETNFTYDVSAPNSPLFSISAGEDGVINAQEKEDGVTITVALNTDDVAVGDVVTITYAASPDSPQSITVTQEMLDNVPPQVVFTVPSEVIINNESLEGSITITDSSNNTSAPSTFSHSVDTIAPGDGETVSAPLVTITGTEGGITADEVTQGLLVNVTPPNGSAPGDTIKLTIAPTEPGAAPVEVIQQIPADWTEGTPIPVIVNKENIPSNGDYEITAIVSDPFGNQSDASTPTPVTFDAQTPIVVVPESEDGINAQEAQDGIQLTITAPASAQPGDIITIAFKSTTPGAETPTDEVVIIPPNWDGISPISSQIPADKIINQGVNNIEVSVTSSTTTAVAPVTIDTLAPGATVTPSSPIVEIPESTDSITAEELKNGIDVLVTPPADTAPGDTITVSISPGGENGEILITQEVPSDWNGITPISVLVPALPPMTDGEQEVTTYVTDTAGNKGQETKQSITVDTDSDVPTIFIPEAENGINAEEAADGISIFINPPNGAGVGYNVIVELLQDGNQIIELSEVIPSDWDGVTPILITVPKADVPEDGSYTVTAIVKHPFFGPAGGLAKEDGIVIDTTAPGTNGTPIAPTLEIPEATNGIDANELLDGVQVTLTIPSDSKPGDKVIFTIKSEENGQELTFESVIPNSWTPGKELSIDIPPTSFSSSGNHNITALVEDIVGNKGQESTPETVILNLSSSQPVVSIAEAENGINKAEALDGIEVVVIAPTGTSPGDTITLSFTKDGEDTAVPITFTVPNDWNGLSPISHNIEPNDIPSDGYYTVITTVTNPEGQKVGDSSTPQTIEIDTVAPGEEGPITQPLIEIPEASEGINAEEAKDGIQVLVKAPSGTIPGDTITLTVESNDGGEPIVVNHTIEDTWNGTDKIKVSISPDEMPKSGQHNISAVVTDNVGNSSEPSTPVTIEIDTESTSPTIFIEEALNSINAAEISDGIQIKVNTPTGTQGGDEITITITSLESGQELSETFTIPNNWDGTSLIDVTFPADKRPPDGDHDIQAVVRRPGQSFIGQPSEKETINIDTVAPGEGTSDPRPGINIPDIDGPFVNKNDISGGLQVLVTPPEGSLIGDTVEVRLYDKGGNLAGTFESIIPNDWELGNAVEIFVSANALRPDGEFSIDAVVIDLAGNPSLPTTSVDFEVDATAPGDGEEFSAPQLVIEEAKSGINKEEIADGIQTELSLPGGTKIGDTIIYTITSRADNSVETLEIAVNSSHFNDSGDLIRPTLITIEESLVPNDGEYNVIVHVKDPAGNLSEGSENVQLSIDTVAPGENTDQPNTFNRIPEAQDGINAEELSDGVEVFVTVPKGSNPGDTIVINIQKSGSNDDNLYDFEIPANWIPGNEISVLVDKGRFPVDGEYDISSSVYDQHGNQSKVSEVTVVTVDTKAPGEGFGPLVKLPENTDGVINKDEAEDGIDVRVTPPEGSQPGDKVVLTVVKEDGTPVSIEYVIPEEWQEPDTIPFTLPATVLPGDGNYKISATVIDKAGNESESSKIIDFELNTKEPGIEPTPITAPTVAVVDATDDGEINAQEFTAASGVSVEVGLPADAQVGDVITLTLTNDSAPAVADTYEHTVTQADVDAKSVNLVVSEFDDKPIADDIYAASATVTRGTDISPATNPAVTFDLDTTAPGAGAGPDGEDVGPTIAIPEQESDDEVTLEEASDGVVVNVKLPAGTEEGDTITLSITKPNGEVVDVEHTIESLPAEQTDGVNVTIPVEVISEDGRFIDGNYDVSASVTDQHGNESEPSEPSTIALNTSDTEEPGAVTPPVVSLPEADDGFINEAEEDGLSVSVIPPANAKANDDITVTLVHATDSDKNITITTKIPADWVVGQALDVAINGLEEDATYTLTATHTQDGTTSNPSGAIEFTVDTTGPGIDPVNPDNNQAPVLTIAEASNNVNVDEASDGVAVSIAVPTGTEKGDVITLTLTQPGGGSVEIKHTIADTWNGSDEIVITIPVNNISSNGLFNDGDYDVSAIVTDAAGNKSIKGESEFTLDTAVITKPVVNIKGINASQNDFIIDEDEIKNDSNENVIAVSVELPHGTAVGDTVKLIVPTTIDAAGFIETVIPDGTDLSQSFNIEIPAPIDGEYSISAQVIDSSGQSSLVSDVVNFAIETSAPTVTLTGPNDSDVIEGEDSNLFTVTLSKEVPAGETVKVYLKYSGDAEKDKDFTEVPYVEITGGNTSVTFDISTLDDSVLELDETITVTLDKVEDANDSAGTAGFHLLPTIDTSKSSSSLTIKPDAEKDAPEFSISGPAQIFDDGPVTFNINVSDAPIRPFPNTTLAHAVELVFEGTDPNTGAFHRYETRVFFPVGETDVSFTITESEMSKFPKDMTSLTATIKNVIAFEVNDWGGYETTPIISATNGAVDVPVIPFVISDALDIGDDYSNTVIKGTGGPGGKLVQLRDENGVVFGETLTTEDGTWEVNVNNATLENQAHQLTAVIFNGTDVSSGINQESKAILFSRSNEGVTSSQTASIEGISQEYIFTGNDNDIINISLNASNHVIVDGGAGGADKVVIDGFTNEFVSGKNAVGQTILTYVGNTNTVTTKVITLIDIEAVAFRDNETPIDVFDKSRVAILDGDGYLDKLDLNRTVYIGGQLVNNEEIVSITLVGKSDAGQTVSFNIDKEFITVDENGKIDARAHEIASQGFASGEITVIMLLDGSSDQLKDTSLITLNPPETIATITHISEDNGISDSDFITQDNQITIFGALDKALESDETLQLRVNQQWITIPSSSITSASDGSGFVWSYNDERFLPDGEYKYEARVVDETGLYSRSSQKTVVIDKENLFNSGSEVSFTRVSADTGKHTDDYVTSDSNFTLEGQLTRKLQDDEVLQLFDGEKWTEIYPTQSTNSEGITHGWSYSTNADLQDGDYSYELRVITKSGHLISSVQQTVTVDTKASTAIVEMTGISPDTGESDGDFITKENQGLVIRGTLSKVLATNEYLEVNLGGVWTQVPSDQITEIDGTVNWTYTDERTLPEGDYVYSFRVSDLAGNSTIEFTKPIFIDTNSASHTASTGAEIGNLKLVDDEGTKDTFLTKDTTIEIKGELSANIIRTDDSLEVFLDGQWQRINTSSQYRDGVFIGASWRLDLQDRELSEGKHDFEFRVVDTAGNITDSLTQSVEIDTTAGAPKVTIDSGNDHFINIKESQEPILVSVDLSDPAIQEGDTLNIRFMVNGKNAVTDEIPVTAEMLEQDTYSLHLPNEVIIDSKVITAVVSISDPADNIRIPDAALVTIDLTAPEAPTVNSLSTSTVKPTISGTAEMSSGDYLTVNIYSGTTLVASYDSKSEHLTIDNGSWSLTLPNELDDGNYTVKATTADEAGNSTEDSSSAVLTISPLADPQSSSPEDGLVTKSLEPQLAPTSNEFLIGDNGDDVMIDALDAPQMTLTSDSGMLTGHSETIEGFVLNEDKLDLSDLIALDNASDLENYLSITSDENSTTISVDKVGEPSQTITLEGVDLSNELQQRQTAVINTLFTNLGDEALLSPSNVSDEMTLNTKQLLDDEDITD